MFSRALGVAGDYEQAIAWYRRAAEQGHASAQANLGDMYFRGLGVDQDAVQAFAWYRKAAEQGCAVAQEQLGEIYIRGLGVEKDLAKAITWYLTAAQNLHRTIHALKDLFHELPPCLKSSQEDSKFIALGEITTLIQESHCELGLYAGMTNHSSGQSFKDGINDDFFSERLSRMERAVFGFERYFEALETPGFLVSGLIPKSSTNAPSVLSSLQIDGEIYQCVGEENVQLGSQLLECLEVLQDRKELRACIDYGQSLIKHFPGELPDSVKGVERMCDKLQSVEGSLSAVVTQFLRKIKEEVDERNLKFMVTYFRT